MFLQYNEIFLEISEIDVHHGAVWVNYGLGQHIIISVGEVNVTYLHVIVHALLVIGLLTTLLSHRNTMQRLFLLCSFSLAILANILSQDGSLVHKMG